MFEQTRGGTEFATGLARQVRSDAAFRQQLLVDPKAAVERELGREHAVQDLYLVLPLASRVHDPLRGYPGGQAGSRLSDADLVSAAGPPQPEEVTTDDPPPGYPPPCFDCIGQGCFD